MALLSSLSLSLKNSENVKRWSRRKRPFSLALPRRCCCGLARPVACTGNIEQKDARVDFLRPPSGRVIKNIEVARAKYREQTRSGKANKLTSFCIFATSQRCLFTVFSLLWGLTLIWQRSCKVPLRLVRLCCTPVDACECTCVSVSGKSNLAIVSLEKPKIQDLTVASVSLKAVLTGTSSYYIVTEMVHL